jgi:acetyl-CoA acetyltransferase
MDERMSSGRARFLDNVSIAGVGFSPFSRQSGRSVLSLALEAARNAIEDAGVAPSEVDGVATFAWQNDSVPAQAVATGLALPGATYLLDLSMGGQAPSFLVMHAAMAVSSGLADTVLVYRAMNGRSGQRVGSHRTAGGASSYRLPVGLSAYPQLIAQWARRYMIETGATDEDLAAVPIAQRRWAAMNERALVTAPLDLDGYRSAPMIADPFRLPDCTIEIDGACALLVTSTARAKSLRHPPAVIRSAAYQCGPHPGVDTGDALMWADYSRNYTSLLADRLWGQAGLRPAEVGCAQLYDCFSSSVLLAVEGLGLADRGGAGEFIRSARLPVNTNGGLLCEGYLHGMNTVAEAVLQVQGRRTDVLARAPETCVVTSGAMMDGSALILGSA